MSKVVGIIKEYKDDVGVVEYNNKEYLMTNNDFCIKGECDYLHPGDKVIFKPLEYDIFDNDKLYIARLIKKTE